MPEGIVTKQCRKCNEFKPQEEFWFNPKGGDGLHSYCKSCHKEWSKVYRQTDKAKQIFRKSVSKYKKRRPQVPNAHNAVKYYVKMGKLIRPTICSKCGIACKPEAHHHKGYEKEFRIDVIWLCHDCHRATVS